MQSYVIAFSVLYHSVLAEHAKWVQYPGTDTFYYVYNNETSVAKWGFNKAREFCKCNGGDLASIENEKENSFIYSLTTEKDLSIQEPASAMYFIGLKSIKAISNLRWENIDGTTKGAWFNWKDNFAAKPNQCAILIGRNTPSNLVAASNKKGHWEAGDCSTLRTHSFVCKRENCTESMITMDELDIRPYTEEEEKNLSCFTFFYALGISFLGGLAVVAGCVFGIKRLNAKKEDPFDHPPKKQLMNAPKPNGKFSFSRSSSLGNLSVELESTRFFQTGYSEASTAMLETVFEPMSEPICQKQEGQYTEPYSY